MTDDNSSRVYQRPISINDSYRTEMRAQVLSFNSRNAESRNAEEYKDNADKNSFLSNFLTS